MSAKFVTAAAVARSPAFDPDAPAPPRYTAGPPFDSLDIRPGRVLLFGAPPGYGKTALALQLVAGILGRQPDLKALVANVEMSPADLLARVVARFAGVPVGRVKDKMLSPDEKKKLQTALAANAGLLERLAFMDPPFSIDHAAGAMTDFGAQLVVIDYVQRFGLAKDLRESLDGLMSGLRKLALAGAAVVAVSSVSRQKDNKGRSAYDGLNMASFRGSAELEFGADSAYILENTDGVTTLKCVKSRYAKPVDVYLTFDGEHQQFGMANTIDVFDAVNGSDPGGRR